MKPTVKPFLEPGDLMVTAHGEVGVYLGCNPQGILNYIALDKFGYTCSLRVTTLEFVGSITWIHDIQEVADTHWHLPWEDTIYGHREAFQSWVESVRDAL